MKRFYLSLGVFALVLSVCGYALFRVWDTRGELLQRTDEILRLTQQETDDRRVAERCEELARYWEQEESSMVRYVRHAHLDEITSAIARLPALAGQEDRAELQAELEVVRTVIDRVWDSELPFFRNIL